MQRAETKRGLKAPEDKIKITEGKDTEDDKDNGAYNLFCRRLFNQCLTFYSHHQYCTSSTLLFRNFLHRSAITQEITVSINPSADTLYIAGEA